MSWLKKLFTGKSASPFQEQLRQLYKSKDSKISPVLPSEDEAKRIVKSAANFPSLLVPNGYMTPLQVSNGLKLLRGEFLVLWWLDKQKKVSTPPQYFLYRYGIDFTTARQKLAKFNLIDGNDHATKLGAKVIKENAQLILEHRSFAGVNSNGKPEYVFAKKKDGTIIPVDKRPFPKRVTEKSLEDYYYYSGSRLSYLWKIKDFEKLESEGLEQINDGNWYPVVFRLLAQVYRKQKRYSDEIDILKKGIGAQDVHRNPGIASRDFQKRLVRATELLNNQH